MSTTSLQKRSSAGAIAIRKFLGKFESLLFLPALARGFVRFSPAGELVADDNPFPFIVTSGAYTAVAGSKLAVNTAAAAVTVTLPANPSAGDMIEITDAAGTFATYNLTVARNGKNINSAASNLTVSTANADFALIYINATIGWKVIYQGANLPSLTVGGAVTSTSSIKSSSATAGIGYATGAGGTVAQATSKATGVTLSKATGDITMNNASLAADTTVSFTLTNTAIAAGDLVIVQHVSGGTVGSYVPTAVSAAGSATIYVRNVSAGALAEAIVLKFVVFKAVTA